MNAEQTYSRIARYFDGISTSPIVVDVPDYASLDKILKHFGVGDVSILKASDFCEYDELPQMDKLKHAVSTHSEKKMLVGLDDFLKLEGGQILKSTLKQFMEIIGDGKTLIITVGCEKWLNYADIRLKGSGQLSFIDGSAAPLKELHFIAPKLCGADRFINGLNELPLQSKMATDEIVVKTSHSTRHFPDSLYNIREYTSRYQMLLTMSPDISVVSEEFGTNEQWDNLYQLVDKFDTLEGTLISFGGKLGLTQAFARFEELDDFGKWHLLLSLKIFGAAENVYLYQAAQKSSSVKDFVTHICEDILDIQVKKDEFKAKYKERRELMSHIIQYPDAIDKYCKLIWGKERDALLYLTDATTKEKETIIAVLDKYGKELGRKSVMNALSVVFPSLRQYLDDYSYGNSVLDKYFREYKFNKVINHISENMLEMVNEQSVKREYNTILSPRSLIVDSLDIDGAELYFMDALGGEYLSYIQSRFFDEGFDIKVQIARCELPSITSVNKDFVSSFKKKGCKVISNKELDELKHEGGVSYDYESTKIPIHLISELQIIDNLIVHLKGSLNKGSRAIIIADHGTSRLAVINESENKWEVSEKGQHSGRCCPMSDIGQKPDFATESNDFWCLANYDRFKGGRKALVEVHGGATLEEVTIPIIEVIKRDKSVHCEVRNDGPLLRSVRNPPVLKLFVEKDCNNVAVELDGIKYFSEASDIPYEHQFILHGIKKAGDYTMDVYCDNVLVARNIPITVGNQGARERSFF